MKEHDVLVDISTALADVVVLLEDHDRSESDASTLKMLTEISGQLTTLLAAMSKREPPTVIAAEPIIIPPAQVTIDAPSGWTFKFDVTTDNDGLIKTIEGKARRDGLGAQRKPTP